MLTILMLLKKGNEGSDISNLSPVDGLMQKINNCILDGLSLPATSAVAGKTIMKMKGVLNMTVKVLITRTVPQKKGREMLR